MKSNLVLKVIKERRSILNFKDEDLSKEEIDTVLEAGRWAPSFANLQPWRFLVIRDGNKREQLYEDVGEVTFFRKGLLDAPAIIAIAVNQEEDPDHYIEAGAVATQNMSLAAHSIGLSSYWIGIFDIAEKRNSVEEKVKDTLELSDNFRVIALLPLGKSDQQEQGERKELDQITRYI